MYLCNIMTNDNKLITYKLETVGTISWLLMDFCWSSEYMIPAWIFSLIALFFSIWALLSYDGNSKSEQYLLGASWMWVMMNSTWLWGDDLNIWWFLVLAKIYFLIAAVLIVLSFRAAKKEGVVVDLKRLKIK